MKSSYYSFQNDNFRVFINCGSGEFSVYFKRRTSLSFSGKCKIINIKYKALK